MTIPPLHHFIKGVTCSALLIAKFDESVNRFCPGAVSLQYLLKDLYCIPYQLGAEGIKKPLLFCLFPFLRIAEVIAEELLAAHGAMTGLKSGHKLPHEFIRLLPGRIIFGPHLAALKPDGHKGAGYCPTGRAHTPHSPSEGPGNPEGTFAIDPQLLSKTGED
jgi:hypothetical protein